MANTNAPPAATNLQAMRALLAKDWRLCRTMMFGLMALGAACYLVSGGIVLYSGASIDVGNVLEALGALALIACYVASPVSCAFGGAALAGERIDRTADFVGLLPVTRRQIVLSKWLVSSAMLGLCVAFHLVILFLAFSVAIHRGSFAYDSLDNPNRWVVESMVESAVWIGCTVSFFGIAWLFTSFFRSAAISAAISFGATIFVTASLAYRMPHYDPLEQVLKLGLVPMLVGLTALIAGTFYYVGRIEP
jgi:ABC-type transport system involved in multi-copper enzyme maturation permease subunit